MIIINKIKHSRFETIFWKIFEKRIFPFISEFVFEIMNEKNFTHYYKEETLDGEKYLRPLYDISNYDFIIISLIVFELENTEFIKENNLDIIPINTQAFLLWLQSFIYDQQILVRINANDPDTNEPVMYSFFVMFFPNYEKIKTIIPLLIK